MARMGVFSRNDTTPDSVPRSLQLLTHRNTFDARYMEIYPNFTEILYPNESISLKVTNFVRTFPMKRPQLSRVRVVQRFAAIPIRLLWSSWEDYIKGENDAQFLLEEPYIVNATTNHKQFLNSNGLPLSDNSASVFGGNVYIAAWDSNTNVVTVGRSPASPSDTSGTLARPRGIVLNSDSYVYPDLRGVVYDPSATFGTNYNYAYAKFGVHELGDYLGAPLYVDLGKMNNAIGSSPQSAPFSAFKFAAYQLCYSYFDRAPNVQTRVDDFYQMSRYSYTDSSFEYPSFVSATRDFSSTQSAPIQFVPPHDYKTSTVDSSGNFQPYDFPRITRVSGSSNVAPRDIAANTDESSSTYRQDVIRSSWENVEKFPLKSGANMSMLAMYNDPVTGLPTYVPSNISLFRMRFANWQTDYFTSCNPWQQRGEEAQIPVSGTVTVSLDGVTFQLSGATVTIPQSQLQAVPLSGSGHSAVGALNSTLHSDSGLYTSNSLYYSADSLTFSSSNTNVGLVIPSHTASVSQSASSTASGSASATPSLFVSPSNFRFAMTLQHIKEMQAQIDNRYQSYIHKFYGARARDYRLDRPEFLGGSVMDLNVSDINQTSQSTSSSPLGDVAGKSVSADSSRTIRYHADEHVVIIGTLHIIPDTEYLDGLNRVDSTQDRFDWALPQFSHLSEQAVYNEELVSNGLGSSNQRAAFGYQLVMNHLRWRPNRASGTFRDVRNATGNYQEYKPWLCVRDFGNVVASNGFVSKVTPTLSDEFLSGRYGRDNSNFDIVDDGILYPFMVDSYFTERLVRVISARGTPSRLGA